jgi:cytochrome c biogenesis protein ResB
MNGWVHLAVAFGVLLVIVALAVIPGTVLRLRDMKRGRP